MKMRNGFVPAQSASTRLNTYLTELLYSVEKFRQCLSYPPIDLEDYRSELLQKLSKLPNLDLNLTKQLIDKIELFVWLLVRCMDSVADRMAYVGRIRTNATLKATGQYGQKLTQVASELRSILAGEPPHNQHMMLYQKKRKEQDKRKHQMLLLGIFIKFMGNLEQGIMNMLAKIVK